MKYESLVVYSIDVYSIFVKYLIKYCVFCDSFKVEECFQHTNYL